MIALTLNRQAYRSVMLALGMAWTGSPMQEEPFPAIVAKLAPSLALATATGGAEPICWPLSRREVSHA